MMRSRMERYYGNEPVPQRTAKNDELYDELYSSKKEPASNITVLDNISEIDLNKIKSIINNREEYKKVREYQKLVNPKDNINDDMDYSLDELETKNYDINEIIERKRSNREYSPDSEKIRKISNTQYDILKGLNINKMLEDSDDEDDEFYTQEKQLKTLISTITKDKDDMDTIQKTALDLFEDLKGDSNTTVVTPPITNQDTTIAETREQRSKENTFYTSTLSFSKEDFEDLEDLKTTVKKNNVIMKIIIIVLILFVICVGFVIASNYIDFKALLK